jgi:hypothetical protein
MDMEITSIKEIPEVLEISKGKTAKALNILRKEKYTKKVIINALNRNILFVRHMKNRQPIIGLLVETVRRQVRLDRNEYGYDKPNGNPVRDRLLEVGKYNPFSPDYVGDIIKNKQPLFGGHKKWAVAE